MRGVPALLIFAASLSAAPGLMARDRPGTPNEVFAGVYETPIERLPRVMVTFRNTASEAVSFWIEWTENGAQMPAPPAARLTCPTGTAQAYHCNIFTMSKTPVTTGFALTRDREYPHAVIFKDLNFDSRYCFRLLAQRKDLVISELWSAWACTTTPSVPPLPGAPLKAQVTFLPGTSGRGDVGPPMPPRALFEWQAPSAGPVAWFVVETVAGGRWSRDLGVHGDRNELKMRGSTSPGELELTLNLRSEVDLERGAPRFRICSVNVSGSACTNAVAGLLLQTATPAAPIGGARAAAEPIIPKPAMTHTPKDGSATSTPAAASIPIAGSASTATAATNRHAATASATESAQDQNSAAVSSRSAELPSSSVDPAAPIVAQSRSSTSARIVARQQPVIVKQPTRTLTADAQASTKVQPSQLAIPARAVSVGDAPAGLDIQTEEIRCRGGGGALLRFESHGEKQASGAGSPVTLMALYFNLPKTDTAGRASAPGAAESRLDPGTCAFAERAFVPGEDPPAVRFETTTARHERTAKKMQHGTSTTADVSPDDESIVKYLESERHFWRFVVHKTNHGYFQAVSHEAWHPKGALQIAGVARNGGSDQVIARLLDVQVVPDLKSVGVRFTARPGAAPTIGIGSEPAVANATGTLALGRPVTQFAAQRDNKNSNAQVTRYVGTSAPGSLEQGTQYHYLVTVPGDGSIPTYQDAGTFRTLTQTATVHFTRIHVIDDSDDEGSGELRFHAYISRSRAPLSGKDYAGELGRFSIPSGENRRLTKDFVIDNAPEVLTIQVQGLDDDTPDAPKVGEDPLYLLTGPTSSSFADGNLARQSFDLSKHWLRSESLPFVMRTKLIGGPASRLLFEVHGYIEVKRPEK